MGIEVLGSSSDLNNVILELALETDESFEGGHRNDELTVDSRRQLENKIEELRLLREMQEFDFDI
ncbi:PA3496 family putative envelope integrity protein [Teredinibacter purpureus]|uniref:PA3496 family putative envelope integrity protein n=1 Tax=Teredinibacter purpureus TaxID=2731756 RepID=UPI0005F892C3|nr:hypothetical protein [Teredinibacter purpureus]